MLVGGRRSPARRHIVTKPIRGSFSFWMASARISRNSSATRAVLTPCVTLVRPLVTQSSGECNVDPYR